MTVRAYRTSLLGAPDPLMQRAIKVAVATGALVLAAVWLAPDRETAIETVEQMPERLAKLVLETPKAPAPPAASAAAADVAMETAPEAAPIPKAEVPVPPKRAARRTAPQPTLAKDQGEAGRERARQEVTQQLATVTSSLENVVSELSTALASTDDGGERKPRSTRRRRARSGRDAAALAGVGAGMPNLMTDASASALSRSGPATGIAIDEIGELAWSGESGQPGSPGAGGGEARSDQSLLGVVRRYAPGIRYCYDNELKKDPGLGGKLVFGITVAASGRVTDVAIVTDSVRSAALTSCATAQIEAWKFPVIPEGVVTFHAPFVFTPPE